MVRRQMEECCVFRREKRTGDDPHYDEMGSVTWLLRQANVTEREAVKTSVGPSAANDVDGDDNDPREDPAAKGDISS